MTPAHALTLYVLLGLLGLSLIIPGLLGMFRLSEGSKWLFAETVDARNHLRALNGMMTAVGIIALWACWDITGARGLVIGLGIVMAALVVARPHAARIAHRRRHGLARLRGAGADLGASERPPRARARRQ